MDSGSIVRETVATKVENILWLDKLREEERETNKKMKFHENIGGRCLVCTLPCGLCQHTSEWYNQQTQRVMKDEPSSLEKEIDDILGVVDEFTVDTKPNIGQDIDINAMQWNLLEQRASDRIGSSSFSLFAPDERGWQSSVALNEKTVLVFGGFRYRKRKVPEPFHSTPVSIEMEFLNDIRAYDVDNMSWHGIRARGHDSNQICDTPQGRFGKKQLVLKFIYSGAGHVAAALDGDRMMVFGGRGELGKVLCDTWVYSCSEDRWRAVTTNESIDMPIPTARVFSSCCQLPGTANVLMYGGTDGVDSFGDLWIFRGDASVMRWERLIPVGLSPGPRYGHQLVAVNENRLAVLGGCCVSPESEVVGSNISINETKSLLEVSSVLQRRYRDENRLVEHSGSALEALAEDLDAPLKEIYRQAAAISGAMHQLEKDTRTAERRMVDEWKVAKAITAYNIKRARHPWPSWMSPFLDYAELMWRQQLYPRISGKLPCARIHFAAGTIGNYIFVLGGSIPTSCKYSQVDHGSCVVNALNLNTMRWEQPTSINAKDYIIEPLRVAEADIIRAQRRIDEEKFRGMSLGALNGKTIELAEAEVILGVCRWRKNMLLSEQQAVLGTPDSRFGCSGAVVRQRMIFIGGWEADSAAKQGANMVLNLEMEEERRRRLEDEYKARMERGRIAEEAQANIANVQSVYELRTLLAAERASEARELSLMRREEVICSLPPLTQPTPVRFVKATQDTIWVTWERPKFNAKKQPIDDANVTYMLYMQSGFQQLLPGDRVSVVIESQDKPSKAGNKRRQTKKADRSCLFFDPSAPRFPGEILNVCGNGLYDVFYDDGKSESSVPRARIKLLDKASDPLRMMPVTPGTSRPATGQQRVDGSLSVPLVVKNRISKKMRQRQRVLMQLDLFRKPPPTVEERYGYQHKSHTNSSAASRISTAASSKSKSRAVKEFDVDELFSIGSTIDTFRSSSACASARLEPTVKVGPEWTLVYTGADNHYVCSGLVPLGALEDEPHLTVPVRFCVQTHGIDVPEYENSQLSAPATFFTRDPGALPQARRDISASAEQGAAATVGMSKTKKDLISAVINGQQMVQIERRTNACLAEGTADHYL